MNFKYGSSTFFVFLFFQLLTAAQASTDLISEWVQTLKPVSAETRKEIEGLDPMALPPNLAEGRLVLVDLDSFRALLHKGIRRGWRPMEFFASPYFTQSVEILYFPPPVVHVINTEFNIASVFMPYGFTRRDFRRDAEVVPKGSFFSMDRLLLGAGRMATTYPFHVSVHRVDYPFNFLTGNYELYRFNVAEIRSKEGEHFLLEHFRGRDSSDAPFRSVTAPMDFPIRKMLVRVERMERVEVLFFAWWSFSHPRIRPFSPPLYVGDSFQPVLPMGFLSATARSACVDCRR